MTPQRTILYLEEGPDGLQLSKGKGREEPRKQTMSKRIQATTGIAVDEMILAGAMISSVGLFAAVSVPWTNVFPGSTSPLQNELTAIEQANNHFYETYRRWPYDMTDGTTTHNAAVLVTKRAMRYPFAQTEDFKALLQDVPFNVEGRRVSLRHSHGQGGRITQMKSDQPAYRLKVVFENMPLSQVKELDLAMDKTADLGNGRLQATTKNGHVNMVYYANPVQTAQK